MGKTYEETVKNALKENKNLNKANKKTKSAEAKAAETRGKRYDKKLYKYAGSKEAQLHAKDFDSGVDRADKRAMKEVLYDSGYVDQVNKFSKGGRVGLKSGSKGCKLAMKGKGRAYGKNS
jgi:hypothetical protein